MGPFLVTMLASSLGFSGFYLGLAGVVLSSAIICRFFHSYFGQTNMKQELIDVLSQHETADSLTDRLTLEVMEQEVIDLSFT